MKNLSAALTRAYDEDETWEVEDTYIQTESTAKHMEINRKDIEDTIEECEENNIIISILIRRKSAFYIVTQLLPVRKVINLC